MAMSTAERSYHGPFTLDDFRAIIHRRLRELAGLALIAVACGAAAALATWSVKDPSLSHATSAPVRNLLGAPGAIAADLATQLFGLATIAIIVPIAAWGWRLFTHRRLDRMRWRLPAWLIGLAAAAAFASCLARTPQWPLPTGIGGVIGDAVIRSIASVVGGPLFGTGRTVAAVSFGIIGLVMLVITSGFGFQRSDGAQDAEGAEEEAEEDDEGGSVSIGWVVHYFLSLKARLFRPIAAAFVHTFAMLLPRRRDGARDAGGAALRGRSGRPAGNGRRPGAGRRRRRRIIAEGVPCRAQAVAASVESRPQVRRRVRAAAAQSARRAEVLGSLRAQHGGDPGDRGFARARARRFRRARRDHPCAAGSGRDALRAGAGAGHQIVAGDRACRRHRPLHERAFGPRRGGVRAATSSASNCRTRSARTVYLRELLAADDFDASERQAAALPRQDHRRRAGHRRPRAHAASADRRHHRLRQVGRHQHHDPVAALPADAGGVPADHGRSENAGTVGL